MQYRADVLQMDFSQMHAHTRNLFHDPHILTPTVSQSTECTPQILSICVCSCAERPHYRTPPWWADSGAHLHILYLFFPWFNFSFLFSFSFPEILTPYTLHHCHANFSSIIFIVILAVPYAAVAKIRHINYTSVCCVIRCLQKIALLSFQAQKP